MCGIVGEAVAGRGGSAGLWLERGEQSLFHRGPDGSGHWRSVDGRVALAHRRLSIIDLSAAASQPMTRGNLVIVFNGEIYNFRELRALLTDEGHDFRTMSDTEVLLACWARWGDGCLDRLNGMFAFVIYDTNHQKLILARDRAGEKPIFYTLRDKRLSFASEIKALMTDSSLSRRIDAEALDCYLAMGFVPGDRCMLSGIRKLPPAHVAEFNLASGALEVRRYWSQPSSPSVSRGTETDDASLVEDLEALLEAAVRRQLVADVPVGVLLSGGVDSSLITAMAARAHSRVRTFTVRFPGHGHLDETEHARMIALHFGTEHVELEAKPTTAETMIRLARQFDEPIIDSSMIPTLLVTELVRRYCTVAIGGDGADELFGGYSHYDRLLRLKRITSAVPYVARRPLSWAISRQLSAGTRGRNWIQAAGSDLNCELPLLASYFDAMGRRRLMTGFGRWPLVAERIYKQRTPNLGDLLQRATRMDFENYLAEDILVKVDRASMLNSLEVRAPFLDRHIIEFAFGKVRSSLKATTSDRKILLKRLAGRVLPPDFDRNRKQGFSIPIASWLERGPFRELFHDVLMDPQCIFDRRAVRGLLDGQAKGRNNGERLFGLVLFELWRREYRAVL